MEVGKSVTRPAVDGDLDAVVDLIAPFVQKDQLLPRSREELADLLQNGFVAEHNERVIGFAAIDVYSKKLAELLCLAVDVPYQGQGVGRQLVQECIRCAHEQNIFELMAITASERLFKEAGFDYSLPNQKRAMFIHPGDHQVGDA